MTAGNIVSICSGIAAVGSLSLAGVIAFKYPDTKKRPKGVTRFSYVMVMLWVLLPPIYFWLDWLYWTLPVDQYTTKHVHDLVRYIWIGFVLVLAAILRIKWPKE